jgi:hypothetical protein
VGGRRETARNAALNRRTLANPATKAIETIAAVLIVLAPGRETTDRS